MGLNHLRRYSPPPPYVDIGGQRRSDSHSIKSETQDDDLQASVSSRTSSADIQPQNTAAIDMLMVPHHDKNNPFAFTTQQLTALVDYKNIDFLERIGGVDGLAKGLFSHITWGLDPMECGLSPISIEELGPSDTENEEKKEPGSNPYENAGFLQRQDIFGSNVLPKIKVAGILELMWISLQDKTLLMLAVSAIVSLSVGIYEDMTVVEYDANGNRVPGVKWVEGVAIIVAVAIVVIVSSVNDHQKEKQFRSLNEKKDDREVTAIRSGRQCMISVHDIQVGDVLKLEPGAILAADGIFIQGHNVKCDESAATGESNAVRKASWQDCMAVRWLTDQRPSMSSASGDEMTPNVVSYRTERDVDTFLDDYASDTWSSTSSQRQHIPDPFLASGSKVIEGVCTYIVTAVGPNSSYGRTLIALRTKDEKTPLQEKLDVLAGSIAKFGLFSAGFLFVATLIRCIIGYATASLSVLPADIISQIMHILITTVTVIVVAVPEGLPLAVTLALAYATQRMLKDNNLVRVLAACETMGNATTICSDKTGTLTQNKMAVVAGTIGSSFRFLRDPPASRTDLVDLLKARIRVPLPVRNFLNQAIAVNSTAFGNVNMHGETALVGNKTETALLAFAKDHLGSEPFEFLRMCWPIEQMFPFSSKHKAMGTVIRVSALDTETKRERIIYRLHIKGASEMLLRQSNHIVSMHCQSYDRFAGVYEGNNYDITARTMTSANRERINKVIQSYATRCLRTLAVCYKDFDSWPANQKLEDIITAGGLTLLAVVGIEDPLRLGVKEATAACQSAGVCVRMVTGDNMLTAKSIARQCGIYTRSTIAMEGQTFRQLTPEERLRVLPQLRVLARSSPEDKRILVNALKESGEIVAVTGDGTNDGPALKAADVGFSMGIAGTEVAKEASSIILMDDNFSSIVRAISWGRCVNDSVKKFLQFQLTVNITAVMLTIISAVSNDEQKSILTAVQLLWVNLIMDTFAALALATDPPTPDLLRRKPEPRSAPLINTCMWKMIVGQSIYQIGVILILLYTDILQLSHDIGTLQTVVFTTFVFCQIFNELNCRRIDNNINIVKGVLQNKFFIFIFLISVTGQIIIVEYGGAAFQTVPLKKEHWILSVLIGLVSLPIGVVVRVIPDEMFVVRLPTRRLKISSRFYKLPSRQQSTFDFPATTPSTFHAGKQTGLEAIDNHEDAARLYSENENCEPIQWQNIV